MMQPADEGHRCPNFPDKVGYTADGWAVRFQGEIQRPRWLDRAAAQAFLDALTAGTRQPEPEDI